MTTRNTPRKSYTDFPSDDESSGCYEGDDFESPSEQESDDDDFSDDEPTMMTQASLPSPKKKMKRPASMTTAHTPNNVPMKKRKVSLSPKDSLAKAGAVNNNGSVVNNAAVTTTTKHKKTPPMKQSSQQPGVIDLVDSPSPTKAVAKAEEGLLARIMDGYTGGNGSGKNGGKPSIINDKRQSPPKPKKTSPPKKPTSMLEKVAEAVQKNAVERKTTPSKVQDVEVVVPAPEKKPTATAKPKQAKAPTKKEANKKDTTAIPATAKKAATVSDKTAANPTKKVAKKKSVANADPTATTASVKNDTNAKPTIAKTTTSTAKNAKPADKAKAAIKKDAKAETTAAKPSKLTAKKAVAPKPKKRKLTFEDQLLHKLFLSCKPHTLKELVKLMDSGEAAVNYTLLSLTDKKWVIKKEFTSKNRSKELYWANQECKDRVLWEKHLTNFVDLKQIQESRMLLGSLQQQHKQLQNALATVLQTPSNEELELQCQAAEQQVGGLRQQLEAMKSRIAAANSHASAQPQQGKPLLIQRSSFKKPPPPPKKKSNPIALKKRINKMRDEWRNRKFKCNDFVDQLADGMEKKVKDVVKLLELETDEMVGVKMPPKYQL